MSGDVQPRKRNKDKMKRKRDDDEIKEKPITIHPTGVHATKMGPNDIQLHVHSDPGTGGHWCAKLIFFSLMTILAGLIGLILLENRGLSDLDTPLSESRYADYLAGWVDEERDNHDEHEDALKSLHAVVSHSNENEPFAEEDDLNDDDDDDDDDDNHHDNDGEDDDDDDHNNDRNSHEDEDEDNNTNDSNEDDNQEKDDTVSQEEMDDDQDDNDNEDESNENDKNLENEDDNDDDDDDDNTTNELDNDDEKKNLDEEVGDDDEDNDNDGDGDNENDNNSFEQNTSSTEEDQENEKSNLFEEDDDDDDDDDDNDDDDDDDESVVDNDKGEDIHLKKMAQTQESDDSGIEDDKPEESSSLAVKIGVGVALVIVAHLVLVKRSQSTETSDDFPADLNKMERRVTIIPPVDIDDEQPLYDDDEREDDYDEDEDIDDDDDEYDKNIDYSDEEIINIEKNEMKDTPIIQDFIPKIIGQQQRYIHPTLSNNKLTDAIVDTTKTATEIPRDKFVINVNLTNKKDDTNNNATKRSENIKPNVIESGPTKTLNFPPSPVPPTSLILSSNEKKTENENNKIRYGDDDDDNDENDGIQYDDDDDELDDEIISENDEEEDDIISDVDDSDLMKRLDSKYGKLPAIDPDDVDDDDGAAIGYGNSGLIADSWTKVKRTNDGGMQSYLEDEEIKDALKEANDMLQDNATTPALKMFKSLLLKHPNSFGVLFGLAQTLDKLSVEKKSNELLDESIAAYLKALELNKKLTDFDLKRVAEICINKMRFRGKNLMAVPVHEQLIERFPDEPDYQNQFAVTYMMINQLAKAKFILHNVLLKWRNNGFAAVHYGFILKNLDNNLEGAVSFLQEGIDSGDNGTVDARFYFNLGDALLRLGRQNEAIKVYEDGTARGLFLSKYQRSIYNVKRLQSRPFWSLKELGQTYTEFLSILQRNWEQIRDEGQNVLKQNGYFLNETENLRDTGDWKQYELFARGRKNEINCKRTPFTCKMIEMFPYARSCTRGQIKFSVMHAGTHIWPHCGPTNCRLRCHLGLIVPKNTFIRVATETKSWSEGKFLIFDDSFEHEVWHNGTGTRLVLIVDVWHPDLTDHEKQTLAPI